MAKPRIARKAIDLRDQLAQAGTGISGEANWPSTAPTQVEVNLQISDLHTSINSIESLKAQLSQARSTLHSQVRNGQKTMKRIDEVTDGLYGSDSPKKENFGLPPKKSSHDTPVPLSQVLITKIKAGTAPASIFVDWDTDAGAHAYELQWFTDAALTQQIGNVSITVSEYEIHGLTVGQQYWVRVRSLRGTDFGTWSDPATFMANL